MSSHQMEVLIAKALAGDVPALEQLLSHYATSLSRYIAQRLPRDAQNQLSEDDVLQNVFIKAFRGIEHCEATSETSFHAWLKTIARNQLINDVTAKRRQKRGGDRQQLHGQRQHESSLLDIVEVLVGQDPTASRQVASKEAIRAIQVGIAQLPDDQRQAIQLHFLEGRTIDQTAAAMGRSAHSVRGLLHRGKSRLAECLGRSSQWLSFG